MIDKIPIVIEPQFAEIEETFDEKYRSMCLAISKGANPRQYVNFRWLSIEMIDTAYKSLLGELVKNDDFEESINSTLASIRFEDGFTYDRASYILQWSKSKVAKLFQAYRNNQCKK
jgi:hypothetical protein